MSSAPQGSWFGRNWFWVVPVGCLVPVVVCCGGIALIVPFAFGVIKDSQIYKDAVAQAKNDPAVTNALGAPVDADWWVGGQWNDAGDTGTAELMIPLKGSKGSGILYADGTKAGGKWTLNTMRLEVQSSGEKINVPVK